MTTLSFFFFCLFARFAKRMWRDDSAKPNLQSNSSYLSRQYKFIWLTMNQVYDKSLTANQFSSLHLGPDNQRLCLIGSRLKNKHRPRLHINLVVGVQPAKKKKKNTAIAHKMTRLNVLLATRVLNGFFFCCFCYCCSCVLFSHFTAEKLIKIHIYTYSQYSRWFVYSISRSLNDEFLIKISHLLHKFCVFIYRGVSKSKNSSCLCDERVRTCMRALALVDLVANRIFCLGWIAVICALDLAWLRRSTYGSIT